MASSTLSRPMDIVVKSIECYNIMILDRNATLHVPVGIVDDLLQVDIGGNVVMRATNIDFSNSTINFSGATIKNFTGNVDGNISFTGNLNVEIVTAQTIYGNTYYGDVVSNNIVGPLMGPVNGNITTSHITEASLGQGITVDGLIYGDIMGNVYGNIIGMTSGVFNGVSAGTFNGSGYGSFFGNFSGNVITDLILPQTIGGDINVFGNLVMEPGYQFIGDATIGNLTVGHITPLFTGNPILLSGDLTATNINATNLNVSGLLTTVTFGTSSVVSPLGIFSALKADTVAQNSIAGTTFLNKVYFNDTVTIYGNLIAGSISASEYRSNDGYFNNIHPNTGSTVSVLSTLDMTAHNINNVAQMQGNVAKVDRIERNHFPSGITINGNLTFDSGLGLIVGEVQTNQLKTARIRETTPGGGVQIQNNTQVTGSLFASTVLSSPAVGTQTLTALTQITGGHITAPDQELTNASNQLALGPVGSTITLSASTPASSVIYTIPDVGLSSDFVLTNGNQTIGGVKTLSTPLATASGGTGFSVYAQGDILYASSVSVLSKLTIGGANRILGINSSNTGPEYKTLTAGTGISITYPSAGVVQIDSQSGVSSFSAGSTGLLPNSPSTGVIVLSGVLNVASGGTGSSVALSSNRIMVSSAGSIVEASALTNGQILIGSTGLAPVAASITGTANQVIVTNAAGSITLSGPQSLGLTSTPTFGSVTLSTTSNQLVMGSGNTVTVTSPAPAASRTYTIPDSGTSTSQFLLANGNRVINDVTTFTGSVNASASGISGSSPNSYVPLIFDANQQTILSGVGGVISVVTYFTDVSVGATADNFTLADGTMVGQIKVIQLLESLGGSAIITVANLVGGTTITIPVQGGEVTLMWNGTAWRAIKRITLTTQTTSPFIS